jgi:hypothetical protein
MDDGAIKDPLAKAFRIAYALGLLICVAWPLLLQVLLRAAVHPVAAMPSEEVRQLGYSFTGLTVAGAVFVAWRSRRSREGLREVPAAARPGRVAREILLGAAILELSALYGVLYYALGGPGAERHARTFLALAPVTFLLFVPRFQAWRASAGEERPS